MTAETDILDVLRRDPGDATALHVYADALLQRGDNRGELVLLQQRDAAELDRPALERLMELVAEHGFLVLPDDPEADVLRFRGGSHHDGNTVTIEYRVVHGGHRYEVIDAPGERMFRILVDDQVVHEQKNSPHNFLHPDVANVILTRISASIRAGEDLEKLALAKITTRNHPRFYVGRFPTDPLPPVLVARWPHAAEWEIERRDLDRWRVLYRRWLALQTT